MYLCFHDSSSNHQSLCFATGWKGKTDERCKGYCPLLLLARAARELCILKKWRGRECKPAGTGALDPAGVPRWPPLPWHSISRVLEGGGHYFNTAFQATRVLTAYSLGVSSVLDPSTVISYRQQSTSWLYSSFFNPWHLCLLLSAKEDKTIPNSGEKIFGLSV